MNPEVDIVSIENEYTKIRSLLDRSLLESENKSQILEEFDVFCQEFVELTNNPVLFTILKSRNPQFDRQKMYSKIVLYFEMFMDCLKYVDNIKDIRIKIVLLVDILTKFTELTEPIDGLTFILIIQSIWSKGQSYTEPPLKNYFTYIKSYITIIFQECIHTLQQNIKDNVQYPNDFGRKFIDILSSIIRDNYLSEPILRLLFTPFVITKNIITGNGRISKQKDYSITVFGFLFGKIETDITSVGQTQNRPVNEVITLISNDELFKEGNYKLTSDDLLLMSDRMCSNESTHKMCKQIYGAYTCRRIKCNLGKYVTIPLYNASSNIKENICRLGTACVSSTGYTRVPIEVPTGGKLFKKNKSSKKSYRKRRTHRKRK